MTTAPPNLTIDTEPYYMIRIVDDEANEWHEWFGKLVKFKRVTAINHARYYAKRHPTHAVYV